MTERTDGAQDTERCPDCAADLTSYADADRCGGCDRPLGRTDGAVVFSGGIEDLERRLAALEAQMRIVRTVTVPALENLALVMLEQIRAACERATGRWLLATARR